ncbi:hypothetical protein FACS1894186_7960 [Alphaproteobacteria bacterium]|nr:hypothetical protein FACS1894186_7960 [Alphaproteobacteria bacterium]
MQSAGLFEETPQYRRIYRETMELVSRVRDFIAEQQPLREVATLDEARGHLSASGELTRLTNHLTATVSWLMMIKALRTHETTLTDLMEEGGSLMETLHNRSVLFVHDTAPQELFDILNDADALYQKLDKMYTTLAARAMN